MLALTVPAHAVDRVIRSRMNGSHDGVRVSAQFGCQADMVNREAQHHAKHQGDCLENTPLTATQCYLPGHQLLT
jgi:hypothetical protein